MVCTFFGHRECYGLNIDTLRKAIESVIEKGVDTFYVGNQVGFDAAVYNCLIDIRKTTPYINISVVLAYMPSLVHTEDSYMKDSIYPEELEGCIPRFAIEKRNKWMLDRSDHCICFVNHAWGGAYKFALLAKRKGLSVISLGSVTPN